MIKDAKTREALYLLYHLMKDMIEQMTIFANENFEKGSDNTQHQLSDFSNDFPKMYDFMKRDKDGVPHYDIDIDVEKAKALSLVFSVADEDDISKILDFFSFNKFGWHDNVYRLNNPCLRNINKSCKYLPNQFEELEASDLLLDCNYLFAQNKYILLIFSYFLASLFSTRLNNDRYRIPYYLQIACERDSTIHRIICLLAEICDVNAGLHDECPEYHTKRRCGYSYQIYTPTNSVNEDIKNLLCSNKDSPVIINGFEDSVNYRNLLREVTNIPNTKRRFGYAENFNTLPLFICPSIKSEYTNVLSIDLTDVEFNERDCKIINENRQILSALVFCLVSEYETYLFPEKDNDKKPAFPFYEYINGYSNNIAQKHTELTVDNAHSVGLLSFFIRGYLNIISSKCYGFRDEIFGTNKNKKKYTFLDMINIIGQNSTIQLSKIHSFYKPAVKTLRFGNKEASMLAKKIVNFYEALKVHIHITKCDVHNDRYVFYIETLQNTTDSDVISKRATVQRRLKEYDIFNVDLSDKKDMKLIVAKESLKDNSLKRILESPLFTNGNSFMPYAVGYDVIGNMSIVDIAKIQHLLIGGTTGSGKSSAIKSLLLSLCYKKPHNVSIIIMDFLGKSGTEGLDPFNGFPLLSCPVVTEPEVGYNVFMELKRYNDSVQPSPQNPHIICIVDEFQKLFEGIDDIDKKLSHKLEKAIKSLLSTARHSNIHFVFATQHPIKENMRADIGNVSSRIALKCTNARNYTCILGEITKDEKELTESLYGKGQMVTGFVGKKKEFIQGSYIRDEEIPKLLAVIKKTYTSEYRNPYIIHDETINQPIIEEAENDTATKENITVKVSDKENELVNAIMWLLPQTETSINKLQKEFHVGFSTAKSLMKKMEELLLVEGKNGKTGWKVIPDSIEDLDDEAKNILLSHGHTLEEISSILSAKSKK